MREERAEGERGGAPGASSVVDDPLTDDAIAGDFRVLQRVRGHRYSLDDVATAWEAAIEAPGARRVLDLGCGLGSVTIMLAYRLPGAQIAAIEAQDVSHDLAVRNVSRNGLSERVELHHGDLRDPALASRWGATFDLVTGTPPYFDPRKSSPSTDAQRTYARIEMRGGIEAYLEAGARALAPAGRMVVCGDARRPERAEAGAAAVGLRLLSRRDVVPREGQPALFSIWVAAREGTGPLEVRAPIVARDAEGARLPIQRTLRAFFGLSSPEHEAPSPRVRERRAR